MAGRSQSGTLKKLLIISPNSTAYNTDSSPYFFEKGILAHNWANIVNAKIIRKEMKIPFTDFPERNAAIYIIIIKKIKV